MPIPVSMSKFVVTRKKMSRRKEISAIDAVGISPLGLDLFFLSNPAIALSIFVLRVRDVFRRAQRQRFYITWLRLLEDEAPNTGVNER